MTEISDVQVALEWRWCAMSILFALTTVGCISSYAGEFRIVPRDGSTPANQHASAKVTDDEIERAARITAEVAAEFDMDERPPPDDELQRQLIEQYGFRSISSYLHIPPGPGRRGLFLSVTLPNDRSCIEVTIRDIDNADETEFTRRLRERLEKRLAEAFPSNEVRFTQSHVDATFAP